jgi:hypothetical protein
LPVIENAVKTKEYKMTATSLAFNETTSATYTARVRELNDTLRRNILSPIALGEVVLTAGVAALKDDDRFALLDAVCCFEDFDESNDPYGEHDFGAVKFKGEKYFFKIDYYDNNLEFHSPDKSDQKLTRRVLTIMRADEY